MLSLGQPSSLPRSLAVNPFYRLVVKYSRYKTGSVKTMFTTEALLMRWAWAALIVMFGLVLPHFEDIEVLAPAIRLVTMVYPFFFIWSVTRISGVELLQLMLEGHWTGEVLAAPVNNADLTRGFLRPLWLVAGRYALMTFFSLFLYGMETSTVVSANGHLYLDAMINQVWFIEAYYFTAIAWIMFVYHARLFSEARLRNGLLKGLATAALFIVGLVFFVAFTWLLFFHPWRAQTPVVLTTLTIITACLVAASAWIYYLLARNFRRYLLGQLGIDLLIYDNADTRATAWS